MLSSLVWLSPDYAPALFTTTSNLLKGAVPSSGDKLSAALAAAEDASCQGITKDAEVRKLLAGGLKDVKDVSDANIVPLGDALMAVLEKKLTAAKGEAAKLEKSLPQSSKATFKELSAALPQSAQPPSEALKSDWLLWNALGNTFNDKELPLPTDKVFKERIALAACAGGGALAKCLLAVQMLENLDAYVQWEMAIPAAKAPSASVEVLCPFNGAQAKEVATRRILLQAGLPLDLAGKAAAKSVKGIGLAHILKDLVAEAKKASVLPLYVEPPAPKAPKQKDGGEGKKKEKKDEEGSGKASKGGEKKAGGVAAAPAANLPAGPFGDFVKATATQELQWSLLSYQLRPRTTLGSAAPGAASAGGAAEVGKIDGFSGTWAPTGTNLPPGHTPYSWSHVMAPGMTDGPTFGLTWSPTSGASNLPPGHTPYSWSRVAAASSSAQASSSTAPAPAPAAGKKPADASNNNKKKGAAAAPAAPAAAATGGASEEEAALMKLDIRCGKIIEVGRVPDADTLYILKVNVGEEQPRQVVTSLVNHYKESDLQDRKVVIYCNIKPGKMRGAESQAMLLAATKDKGSPNEVCELLDPPAGAKEGTRVQAGKVEAGAASEGASVKYIHKVWGVVQPCLKMSDKKEATFQGATLTFPEGTVTAKTLTGCGIY
mmetsp:Transcript_43283/g.92637  ORF Transcript_43283/g.92637 Transcript_43283/m.92637 type:complete len:658 (-) Transcript_43283:16-1989(-)